MNIRTGDNVKVIAGREKGKTGKVMQSFPKEGKVVVEHLNVRTRHLKAREQQQGPARGIFRAAPGRERHARLPEMLGADAHRARHPRRRQKGPRLQEM